MKSVGIVGAGSFGLFLAEHVSNQCQVKVYSRSGKGGQWSASLQTVAACDYLILSIPLEAYETLLDELGPLLASNTVIVDVCSVKEAPTDLIRKKLPNRALVATHPLFGPESASDSLEGHTLVLCTDVSDPAALEVVSVFGKSLGLDEVRMTAAEHDEEMAVVQGLTFFIARALRETGIHEQKLQTPTFKRLLYLAEIDTHHSDDLFETIQKGNSRTAAIRQKFIDSIDELNATLD